jgi:mono/diheme cytochrome c family protein
MRGARRAVLGGVVVLGLVAIGTAAGAQGRAARGKDAQLVKRGEYLVTVGGCHDCHTPHVSHPELGLLVPDMSRMLMGQPAGGPGPASALTGQDIGIIGPGFTSFRLPFGVVYAANLTPDENTGLGRWTDEQFIQSMRTGMKMGIAGGAPILPPMPWPNFARMTDEDLRAIHAYLRSIPPIANAVPQNEVAPEVQRQMVAAYEKLVAGGGHGQQPKPAR